MTHLDENDNLIDVTKIKTTTNTTGDIDVASPFTNQSHKTLNSAIKSLCDVSLNVKKQLHHY